MKEIRKFVRTTIVGGLLFMIPIVVIVILLGKVYNFLKRLITPFVTDIGDVNLGGFTLTAIITVFIILILCFLAGLLAKTSVANRFVRWIETSLLEQLPGYTFLKNMGKASAGLEDQEMKIVLARVDDGWQISFLIEQINDNLYTVFIPGAPSPWSGSIYHLEKDRIKWTDMTQKEALKCIRKLGYGSAKILKKPLLRY